MQDLKLRLKTYIENNLTKEKAARNIAILSSEKYYDDIEDNIFYKSSVPITIDIKDYINEHQKYNNFQTLLFKLIDEKGLKDSDVYNKVHIDRRLFSKIRSAKNYHPSKDTVILLSIALELSEEQLEELLESASYSLPKNNNYDLIIRFCFINKIFKLTDINELLLEYNCKVFNY